MIEVKNLTKIYNKNKKNELKALDNVTFKIEDGMFVSIMGKSGSGKSTLMHILALIDEMTSGLVLIDGIDINKLKLKELNSFKKENISIVLQDYFLVDDLTVLDNLMIPLAFKKMKKQEKYDLIGKYLNMLDILKYINTPIYELSGGEKQRVAIARALINDTKYIFADEPTGSLDIENTKKIMEIFKNINKTLNKTIIIITHDLMVSAYADVVIKLCDGKIQS